MNTGTGRSGPVDGPEYVLKPHPNTPPSDIEAVKVRIWTSDANEALIAFTVIGPASLRIPSAAPPQRRDGLWQTTCFELFLKSADGSYFEFNFSPSSQWAAYRFDGYRAGMQGLEMAVEPQIETLRSGGTLSVEVDVDFGSIPMSPLAMGLSAVIEEMDGTISYWALAHPPGQPDFHHPACFAAMLPAPQAS